MDQQQTIAEIERRAKAAGLTIGEACARAGVHPTTFSRWKLSPRNPNPINATFSSLKRIEAAVTEAEAADTARAA